MAGNTRVTGAQETWGFKWPSSRVEGSEGERPWVWRGVPGILRGLCMWRSRAARSRGTEGKPKQSLELG